MPNYINTSALADGQTANADDVKTPLETLDQKLYDVVNGNDAITPDIDGDMLLATTGSSNTAPRQIGMTGIVSGERVRFPLGDIYNALQTGYNRTVDLYAYNTIRLVGGRQSLSTLDHVQIGDMGVLVTTGESDHKVLVVDGVAGQSADLQQWRDSSQTVLATVAADGVFTTLGQVLTVTTAPGSSPTDAVQLWAEDVGGSAELRVSDEAGNITTLSPHNPQLFSAADRLTDYVHKEVNPFTGKQIELDIYGALRALEQITGEAFVHVAALSAADRLDWDVVEQEKVRRSQAEHERWLALPAAERYEREPEIYQARPMPTRLKQIEQMTPQATIAQQASVIADLEARLAALEAQVGAAE